MTSSRRLQEHQPDRGDELSCAGEKSATTESVTLIRSLNDADWRVRKAAAQSLSDSRDPAATSLVVEAMRSDHSNLRVLNGAIRALVRVGIDVVLPLAGLLADPDAQLRIAAILTLGERKDPRAIPFVMQTLDDADANVRFHAVEALGKLRAGVAVDALVAIAQSREFDLAAPALDALAEIGDCSVAADLQSLLDDELLQFSAVQALGRLGDEETAKVLVGLVNSSDLLRAGAVQALVDIWKRFEQSFGRGDLIAELVASTISPEGLDAVLAAATRGQGAAAAAFVTLLGWGHDPRAEPIFVECLDLPAVRPTATAALLRNGAHAPELAVHLLSGVDPETKVAVLKILAQAGDRRFVSDIVVAVQAEPEIAVAAMKALAAVGDASAFEALVPFLGHTEPAVRQAAVEAIQSLDIPVVATAVPALFEDENPLVRESAIRIAAGSEVVRTDLLLPRCHDENEFVRCAAFDALGLMGELQVLPILTEAARSDSATIRAGAVQALRGLENPAVGPLLRTAMHDGDPWVRYFAVRSLAERREADSHDEFLHIAEHDLALPVRAAAIDALGQIRSPGSIPLLMKMAGAADRDLRDAALAALGPVARCETLVPLVSAARGAEPSSRLTAIRSLGTSSDRDAVEALRQIATEDFDPVVVRAAVDALEQSPATSACETLLQLTFFPACHDLCVTALSRLDETHLEQIARGLADDVLDVRRATVEALSRHAARRAHELLKLVVNDPHKSIRIAARQCLAVSLARRSPITVRP